jgi:aminopeptidase N
MKYFFPPTLLAALVLILACTPKTGSKIASTPNPPGEPAAWDSIGKPLMGQDAETPAEYTILDNLEVRPADEAPLDSLRPYNPSHTFEVDLLHTKVEISFDWAKKRANGKATLSMRPWFYATDRVTLDAKNFDIKSINFEGKTEELQYNYDNVQLTVKLGRTFTRNEEFKLVVVYTAKPDERTSFGGSAAITGDKGLYFVNADGADPDKPMQIWTQGETESNSYWMPTVDKPNERCTQEMYITVEDKFKTLSNGVMVSSRKNADGTRTDYWKMDKPHAPYLFMMAIGDFAIVKDKWRGIDLDYYVEPKYAQYARDIFPHTAEILEFISNKLNYPYPWPKLGQVVVRDYVSGAMENTTGIIYGDYVQKTRRELMDDHLTNEKVVMHEIFHHWFGDLVTTESWANLTLNEGFANYSEYLWMEHKYGRDAADDHLMTETQGYLFSTGGGAHPLIHFGYADREDMFDAHSYNKGGCTLHMLREEIGDDAFFTALNRYLKKNEYTDVEADELRMAFEDVTGRDLNWFWNQWYFGAGHPELDIQYGWDEAAKKAGVTIAQNQEGTDVPRIFEMPLAIDIYDASGKARREHIRVTKRSQTFYFSAAEKPALINVDAKKTLICVKNDQHSAEEWAFMYRHAPLFRDRAEALDALQGDEMAAGKQVRFEALSDKFHGLRERALQSADPADPATLAIVLKMAESDPDHAVRANALAILGGTKDKQYMPLLQKNLSNDQPYSVVGAALSGLQQIDPQVALEASKTLQGDDSEAFTPILAELYANTPERSNLPFFEQKLNKVEGFAAFSFLEQYQKFLFGLGDAALIDAGAERLKAIALNMETSQFRRFGATKAIADLRNGFTQKGDTAKAGALNKLIEEIKEKETDETLKFYYGSF